MPRLPRDISGAELARKLGTYGYQVSRQTGSHLRLTRNESGSDQHVTIPRTTLARRHAEWDFDAVAVQLETTKEDLVHEMFG